MITTFTTPPSYLSLLRLLIPFPALSIVPPTLLPPLPQPLTRKRAKKQFPDFAKQGGIAKPKKADFRQRAHANPLSDFLAPCPTSPDWVDWGHHYPELVRLQERLETGDHPVAQSLEGGEGDPSSATLEEQLLTEISLAVHAKEEPIAEPDRLAAEAGAGADEEEPASLGCGAGAGAGAPLYLNTHEYPVDYSQKPNTLSPVKNNRTGLVNVDFLDVGCGFGGLTVALAAAFPDKISMGLEIREQVTNYVGLRVLALRQQYRRALAAQKTSSSSPKQAAAARMEDPPDAGAGAETQEKPPSSEQDALNTIPAPNDPLPHHYYNASVLRTNAMKTMPCYFRKNQLSKLFFCFPDPHFKKRVQRRRVINPSLLSVYAYCLKPSGRVYCITDVKDLHDWMYSSLKGRDDRR